MASFEYVALRPEGGRVTGTLAAASEAAVLAELDAKKWLPVRVREVGRGAAGGSKIAARALGDSYKQLADLLGAGVPMMRALSLLARRKSKPKLAAVYQKIAEHVGDGGELSEAMELQPAAFPRVHAAMIRAGERGGFLEDVLKRLGEMVIGQARLNAQVQGSLVYPGVVVTVGAIVVGVIFGVFVPMFREMFARMPTLPAVTKLVFGLSDLVAAYGLPIGIVLILACAAGLRYRTKPAVRDRISIALTRAPVIGGITRSLAAARFCRLLGTMEANGVPMLQALEIAREAAGNMLMERAVGEAIESVRGGGQLAPALTPSGLFGDDVVEMIAVGEAAGNVDEVLLGVADTLEERVANLLAAAVKLIEPALLVTIAMAVVTVAVAILLPLTQMTSQI